MKSRHNRSLNALWRIGAAAMLCAAAGASAQSVHREVDIDGGITFTDRPETTALPQAAHEGPDVASALARHASMTSMSAVTVDFNEAARRLARARQNRQEGLDPRPGENIEAASVGRMNARYQRGRQRLDNEVMAAQRRANETSLARSALSRNDDRIDARKRAQP